MLIAEYSYETDIKVQRREAYREGLAEGIEQGAEQKAIETAKRFISMGLSLEQVSAGTDLPLETVEKLKQELNIINN